MPTLVLLGLFAAWWLRGPEAFPAWLLAAVEEPEPGEDGDDAGSDVPGASEAPAWVTFDITDSAGAEYLVRVVVGTESGARRNPRAPVFDGLEDFLATSMRQDGSLAMMGYEKYVADHRQVQAQIMKQERLFADESASRKKQEEEGGGPRKDKKDKKVKKDKKGKGEGKGKEE